MNISKGDEKVLINTLKVMREMEEFDTGIEHSEDIDHYEWLINYRSLVGDNPVLLTHRHIVAHWEDEIGVA